MRFVFNDQEFQLDFSRTQQKRKKQVSRTTKAILSTLTRVEGARPTLTLVQEAETVCHPGDRYTHESGRLFALRKLTDQIYDKGLKASIWDTYTNRPKGTPEVVVAAQVQDA